MVTVVGVRFKKAGKIYYFDPGDLDIKKDDYVIVETIRGIEFGHVIVGPKQVTEDEIVSPLKKVISIATEEDCEAHRINTQKAQDAFRICEEKIAEHRLPMKLIDVEYTFDNNKVIFYFTAEGRVDFRDLVKDLAAIFKTRIELRQIGVRDEVKMVGGLGPCGRVACCHSFLGEFEPVSIKMAKDQSLSLNPTKISGLCGRLMCCLKFEHKTYEELLADMPSVGTVVLTPMGQGTVEETFTLPQMVKVRVKLDDDTEELYNYRVDEIIITQEKDSKYEQEEETLEEYVDYNGETLEKLQELAEDEYDNSKF